MKRFELLSPAGDVDCAKAAILAGADALYLGLPQFNARKRATNITIEDLKSLSELAHSRNCRIFVTVNILLTDSELPAALELVEQATKAGADAIIVQDVGLLRKIRESYPGVEIHASTQMTLHNQRQLEFVSSLGAKQVNFLRELSLEELKPLMAKAHSLGLKNELFIHGAFCLSCSGICYMSGLTTHQPGNRGACVQPCRRGYSLEKGGKKLPYLNLKDNETISLLPQMTEAGADTFKIEGRIKDYRYVYEATKAYRGVLDTIEFSTPKTTANTTECEKAIEIGKKGLRKIFNRDLSENYLLGNIYEGQFQPQFLDQSLKFCGKVAKFTADTMLLEIETHRSFDIGTTLAIYHSSGELKSGTEFVAQIKLVESRGSNRYRVKIQNVLKGKILKGNQLYLLPQYADETNLLESIRRLTPAKRGLHFELSGVVGTPLRITATLIDSDFSVTQESELLLQRANQQGFTQENLRKQLSRLGETPFELTSLSISKLEEGLFLPVKALNELRRTLTTELETKIAAEPRTAKAQQKVEGKKRPLTAEPVAHRRLGIGPFTLLTNDPNDLCLLNDDEILFMPFDGESNLAKFNKRVRPWVGAFILEDEVEAILAKLRKLPTGVVVCDNVGVGMGLSELGIPWIAGPQLNSSNSESFKSYAKVGASGGFLSMEISREQAKEAVKNCKKGNRETGEKETTNREPENMETLEIFQKVFGPLLLMTTRQCLNRRIVGCPQKKAAKDGRCLHHCHYALTLFDEKEMAIHLEKRCGNEAELYNDAILSVPEAVSEVAADHFLLDFRDFTFFKPTFEEKRAILKRFRGESDCEINEIFGNRYRLTRGAYKKGF